ncbi:hypothetical protein AMR77_25415 [Escherichia coli]|nr:hypothetical protein AMR77_25415 [Escherichia coli]
MVLSEMAPRVEPAHARISWRIWCVQAVAFALSSLCLVGLLIVAYFFDAGFPCFYATAAVRVGVNNTHHAVVRGGVAIALGLGAQSVVGTYVTTAVALVAAAIYMLAGAATSKYRHDMDTGTRLAAVYMVAPQTTLVFGAACPWLLQITVILLSHRILMLAHVMYVLHFVCLACFAFHFCTRGVFSGTYVRQVHSMIDAAPTHHRVIGPIRAVMTNVLLLVAFMSSAAAAASVNAVVASNFNTSAPGMIVTTAGAFAALIVCLLLVVEFLLSHYVHVLLGPHLGAIAAAGMVGVATEYYYSSSYYVTETQWSGVHGGTRAVLAIVAVFVLIMAVARMWACGGLCKASAAALVPGRRQSRCTPRRATSRWLNPKATAGKNQYTRTSRATEMKKYTLALDPRSAKSPSTIRLAIGDTIPTRQIFIFCYQ